MDQAELVHVAHAFADLYENVPWTPFAYIPGVFVELWLGPHTTAVFKQVASLGVLGDHIGFESDLEGIDKGDDVIALRKHRHGFNLVYAMLRLE